ncbi:aminodeoxychorismate synthase component I [Marinimicrobium sp. C2-29]|uniref:aminodeoxychorismate synthase component I n=1 Tax=Marinimicrobium sp. C2-29 TaxID=3139825 RepID=UPI003139375C
MRPSPTVIPLPYFADSAHWFAALSGWRSPVWLDSGHPGSSYGRYDILAAEPDQQLTTFGGQTHIERSGKPALRSTDNPFALIERHSPPPLAPVPGLPFVTGAIGYFGYDLGRSASGPDQAQSDVGLPDLWLGFYPWAVIQDHREQRCFLVCRPESPAPEIQARLMAGLDKVDLMSFIKSEDLSFNINHFKANIKADYYLKSLGRIQEYIRAGDCYQVNFAQRFSADYTGDPARAYLALRQTLPSPFSGYIPLEAGAILSLSPERFVELRGGRAETKPIKGTMARGDTPESDRANAEALVASAKNRAENLMIVDLLRNDLSKSCTRVEVPQLFELQSFANVHHLVSTVTGQLRPDASALDLLAGCFPGGSITGAPKIRAMEIIEELEPSRRSVYCGSLGYLSADGAMDTNIAIRTLVCDRGRMHCWGGGGIVADSDPEEEYRESIAKVEVLMRTLEQKFGASS